MMKWFYGSAAVAALAFAGTAFASQIDVNTNTGNEPSLYDIANSPSYGNPDGTEALFSGLNANSAQTNNGYWTIGATSTSTSVLEATWTANYDNATFGVYSLNNPSNQLNLLGNGSGIGPSTNDITATLRYSGNGMFVSYATDRYGNKVGGTQESNFGSSVFGYFLTIGGTTYYSDSSLNDGNKDRMVGYQGNGSGTALSNEYLFGWEDGTDNDYQDYVATVESVRPVPEPSSIAMFGVGLLMIGFAARRLQKRDV
ncbi:PEP-CTERM sorting domain-containing protein [Salinisphaera hydrothermalis]|uniref:PEP motif putative anchor domain-containing protein n=1 Tax=Salinisphaera hydrothermalis (strain C41B8) TaxID=1304275 RepID=A0A084IMB1_SALHC|nr:PEP-CTERM sorting domain-containing protein [Salinisphaera hydrothermalis]KEZ77845.1 PEP motif putative anchor domain-containing protein [Salinisphaera hydrothermalis C41B8]